MGALSLAVSDLGLVLDPLEKIRGFFSLSRDTSSSLPCSTAAALRGVCESLRSTVTGVSQCATSEDFEAWRREALPKYAKYLFAASLIAQADMEDRQFFSLACESLDEIKREFISAGIGQFGSDAPEQVTFCIFTLKRIVRLLPGVVTEAPRNHRCKERDLIAQFGGYMLLTHFHLDCLRALLERTAQLSPPVAEDVLAGLSACSGAYATLRQGIELRQTPKLGLVESMTWDDEDQVLLDESERSGSPIAFA